MNRFSAAAFLAIALSILVATSGCVKKPDIYPADVISEETAFEALKSILGGPDNLIERGGYSEAVYSGRILEDDCD